MTKKTADERIFIGGLQPHHVPDEDKIIQKQETPGPGMYDVRSKCHVLSRRRPVYPKRHVSWTRCRSTKITGTRMESPRAPSQSTLNPRKVRLSSAGAACHRVPFSAVTETTEYAALSPRVGFAQAGREGRQKQFISKEHLVRSPRVLTREVDYPACQDTIGTRRRGLKGSFQQSSRKDYKKMFISPAHQRSKDSGDTAVVDFAAPNSFEKTTRASPSVAFHRSARSSTKLYLSREHQKVAGANYTQNADYPQQETTTTLGAMVSSRIVSSPAYGFGTSSRLHFRTAYNPGYFN